MKIAKYELEIVALKMVSDDDMCKIHKSLKNISTIGLILGEINEKNPGFVDKYYLSGTIKPIEEPVRETKEPLPIVIPEAKINMNHVLGCLVVMMGICDNADVSKISIAISVAFGMSKEDAADMVIEFMANLAKARQEKDEEPK